ncbi:myeloid cell surface antigen CD33-like [Carassius carassius]|uniref:myeloid cell surface antigen CD33-like n=1 Tax=Carassius carassius TaxID=217509 RepID=UPI002868C659|nr:myeloid cell surface antigen CD33-like [Carassius carassius]
MQIITTCTILFILILNMLCTGQEKNDWNITFHPPEVTAVTGLCVLISCTFTYPGEAKPSNVLWNACNKKGNCSEIFNLRKLTDENVKENKSRRIEMLEHDLTKNNCSIIMKNITAIDKKHYMLRLEESSRNTYNLTVKITIQDKPKMKVPLLIEGQKADLRCSAPFPCPETPPKITWWIKTREENITYLKDNIILTNSKSLYNSTLTLTLTSDLDNATVACEVSYGSKTISTNRTLKVTCDTNELKVNKSFSPGSENIPQNDTTKTTGIEDFFKNLNISTILAFVVGMMCSALIFSMVLCCWVFCHRCKHKVPTANTETEDNLEMVQTDVAQTGINEQTPLHGQLNGGNPNTAEPTDTAEVDKAVGAEAGEVDYASIDYSLLKARPPEEQETEPTDTDYAEIKRDRRGDGKEREVLQDEDDQLETPNQMDGEEEPYPNSQELKS